MFRPMRQMSAMYPLALETQDMLEGMLRRCAPRDSIREAKYAPLVVIYFTARWCGACKAVDLPYLMSIRNDIVWYKCDIDQNQFSAGFCGVKKIPSFQIIRDGNPEPLVSTNNTAQLASLIRQL